jgi:hypothetical protein
MRFNQGAMTAENCRDEQCHQCPGYGWPAGADLPYTCDHDCHIEPPPCLDDIELTPEAELLGDAIRHENREAFDG